ncbi:snoRNA binding protein [Paecilomyces variotii No. 5]|uniref:SnoRNA binding protein n=1 Tax=Byssochlamys spectabilis (strain No. 5 / NBRC 109023) TaxID=1356009 RepID=V5FEG0_BYSSN|nr:snoRNA binding protein [Paecilomyces variotii No. 5]
MPSVDGSRYDGPSAKRQKRIPDEGVQKKTRHQGSEIFSPFRTLGLVSPTDVPFTAVRLGKSTFQITTSVGRSLQTYDLRRGLNLVFLTRPQTPDIITATYAWKDAVFAAWGGLRPGSPAGIWIFKRGKKVAELQSLPGAVEPIEQILVFGSWIIGRCGRSIHVWKSVSFEHYTTLTPAESGGSSGKQIFTGKMCTMPTYLNKIFVGKFDGSVDIYNVSSGKLLYSILPTAPSTGAVTTLEPTPALSLIAIAYKNGCLSIHNVETDQSVLSLRSNSTKAPAVTSIAFRTDDLGAGEDGRKSGVMATAAADSGDITMWDLNFGGRVTGILRGAHETSSHDKESGISGIAFLDGQPIMVSSGKDNALRTWIFEETPFSPIPRLLHSRSGHSAAVTTLTFLPAPSDGSETVGKWLLSASKDHSLWGFSLRKDGQNTELSQGNVKSTAKKLAGTRGRSGEAVKSEDLKAPEITCMACSLNRDGGMALAVSGPVWSNTRGTEAEASSVLGWESIVTGHRGDKYARTWFWGKKKAGRWAFETSDGTEVKSVAVSSCGTFALIGSAGGSIDMFNLQSGLHRQSFPARLRNPSKKFAAAEGKHTKAVTGIMVDSLNRTVVSCGLDGRVKFWDLLSGRLINELNWHPMTAIVGLRYSNASDLVAFSCDDLSIRVVDIETMKVVREFWGCIGQVNDFCFSNDGRWIVAASMDSIIRIWDLPTGHLIDAFRVASTCTSLSFSSTGEFLATAHADGVGINLWSNRSLFTHIPTRHIDEDDIAEIAAPTASGENGSGTIEAAFTDDDGREEQDGPALSFEQLSEEMMTLSVVPRSRWQTLLHLDVIKERNKPKEAPKAPEKAPFFLPSLVGQDDMNTAIEGNGNGKAGKGSSTDAATERSRIARIQSEQGSGLGGPHFNALLRSGSESGNFEPFVEFLKSLPPAKADLEIRSLDPRIQSGRCELVDFVTALTERLRMKRDFELVNAWMAVFLKVHADILGDWSTSTDDEHQVAQLLREALAVWKSEEQREAKRLAALMGYCRGVVGFLRSAR